MDGHLWERFNLSCSDQNSFLSCDVVVLGFAGLALIT